MTNRTISSKTILGVGTYPGWEPYDQFFKNQAGGNTPQALLADGIVNENNYVMNSYLLTSGQCLMNGQNFLGTHVLCGTPSVPTETLEYPTAYSLAGKLEARWRDSQFSAGVTFGESKESLIMMADRIVGLCEALRSLRRGNLGGALRNLTGQVPRGSRRNARALMDARDISGAWLEINLGWSPMLSDIYNAEAALKPQPIKNRVMARSSVRCPMTVTGNGSDWFVKGQMVKHTQVIAYVSRDEHTLNRWGLTDPAGIAWALTPLSFVADWFLPITKGLANWHAIGSFPSEKVIVTQYAKAYGKSYCQANPVAGLQHTAPGTYVGNGVYRQWDVNRGIFTSMLDAVGTLAFLPASITPRWNPNAWRVFTGASLLHQWLMDLHRNR